MSKASKARKSRAATKYSHLPFAQRRNAQNAWLYWTVCFQESLEGFVNYVEMTGDNGVPQNEEGEGSE